MPICARPANPHVAACGTYPATQEQRRAGDFSLCSELTGVANSAARYAVFESRCERVQARSPVAFAACPTGVEQTHWAQALTDLADVTELDWIDALRRGLPMTAVGRATGNLWIEGLIRSGRAPAGLTEDEWIDALDHLWHTEQAQWINALLYLRDMPLADGHASPLVCYIRDAIARPAHIGTEAWNNALEWIRQDRPGIDRPDLDRRSIATAWTDAYNACTPLFFPSDRVDTTLAERFERLEQHADFHSLCPARAIESDAWPVLQMTLAIASTWLPPPLRKSRLVRALTPAIPDPRPALNAYKIFRAIAELGTGMLAMQAIANHLRTPRCIPLNIPVSPTDRHYGETTLEVLDDDGLAQVIPGRERIAMIKRMPVNYDNDYRARAIAFLDAQQAA